MIYKRTNCDCGNPLKPDDERQCNPCLMKMIQAHRPSVFEPIGKTYSDLIHENYVQNPITKVWTKKSKDGEELNLTSS